MTDDATGERRRRGALDRPAVGTLLDVEAGLRDVLLRTRYADLTGEVAALLDVGAGLTALLDAARTTPPDGPPVEWPEPADADPPSGVRDREPGAAAPADRVAEVVAEIMATGREVFALTSRWSALGGHQIDIEALRRAGASLFGLAVDVEERNVEWADAQTTLLDVERGLLHSIRAATTAPGRLTVALRVHLRVTERVRALRPLIARLFDWSDERVDVPG